MTGKTVLVTGASDGIGAEAAKVLAGKGATVLVTGRSADKLAPVAKAVGTEPLVADFSRLDDVRRLAAEVAERAPRIDVLLNNAGGTFAPSQRTHDGHEPNFQINHLAPFLLTNLLQPHLVAAEASLVVNTSSIANLGGKIVLDDLDYENRRAIEFRAYGTGKLMNILFTRGLAQRWTDQGVVSVAVHPGPVGSSFGRDSFFVGLLYRTPLKRLATISVADGAAPLVMLAERGADLEIDGRYFSRFQPDGRENKQASDQALIDGLWERSAAFVGVTRLTGCRSAPPRTVTAGVTCGPRSTTRATTRRSSPTPSAAALAEEQVVSFYVHHEPTFDRDEVRRHLSVVVLTPTRARAAAHRRAPGDDLLPEPYTSTSTEAIRLSRGEVGGGHPDGRQPDVRLDASRPRP